MTESRLAVGYVAGAHGIRGTLRVKLHDERSDALASGRTIELWRDGTIVRRSEVTAADAVPGRRGLWRVQLTGIDGRDEAEGLRGCEVRVERDELPPLDDDEFYLADLVGAEVVEHVEGESRALGHVAAITSNGVQDLLEIEWVAPDGTAHAWLLPVLPQFIIEIDLPRVVVDVPPGFLPEALDREHRPGS